MHLVLVSDIGDTVESKISISVAVAMVDGLRI